MTNYRNDLAVLYLLMFGLRRPCYKPTWDIVRWYHLDDVTA